jgi:hypothetical protein
MSLISFLSNRSLWKFVLAVSIPSAIVYFFWYSQQQAGVAVKEWEAEQKAHPTTDHVVINDYAMKEIDDGNHLRWQLVAKTGTLMPNGKDVELSDVKVDYYDSKSHELKMSMKAPLGHANQETKFVKLTGTKNQRVVAEGGGFKKSHFECAQVELIKKNEFLASGGVIIDWPGVAKVSGSLASGTTDMSAGPKNLKVIGNTHAEIAVR